MVFAEARNVDFANQDHFVMVFRKDSIIDHVWRGSKLPFSLLCCVWGGIGMGVYTCEGNEKKKRGGEGEGGGCDCRDRRQKDDMPARRSS